MKRITFRTLTSLLCIAILFSIALATGCSRDSSSNEDATGIYGGIDISQLTNKKITIVSHFDPGSKDENTAIGKAVLWWENEVGGEVDLRILAADIYPTRLMAMIGAGNAPELIMVDQRGWMPRLPVVNIIKPVNEYISKEDMLDYEQTVFDQLTWKGNHYALYVNGAWAPTIWYNKTMFESNGLDTPRQYAERGEWTWENFVKVAKELTADTNNDGVIDTWGYANWSVEIWPASNNAAMTRDNGDGTVDVIWNEQAFMQSAQFAADLMTEHNVWSPDLGFHVNNFKAGNVAMSAGYNDFVSAFTDGMRDELDNAPLPLGPNQDPENPRYVGNALFFGVGNGAKNIDGARAFAAKMREFEKEIRDSNVIIPNSNLSYLTPEQILTSEEADSRVILNYESGFGDWENLRWGFWGDILFNNIPVATALSTFKPVLENEIRTTLESELVDVKPFNPIPVETFESGDISGIPISQKYIEGNPVDIEMQVSSDNPIDGAYSLNLNYPGSDSWVILAHTDDKKLELPSYHRYIVKFDYLLQSDKAVNVYLTIRPKATMESDEVSHGFATITMTPGEKNSAEVTIDVLSHSEDNVLVFLTEQWGLDLLIDNFVIEE